MRFFSRRSFLLSLLSLLAALAVFFAVDIFLFFSRPLLKSPVPPPKENYFAYDIPEGTTLKRILSDLRDKGLLQQPYYLEWYAKWTEQSHAVKPGEYHIPWESSPLEVLQQWIDGRVVLHPVLILEGWNFVEVRQALQRKPFLRHELTGLTSGGVMVHLGYPGQYPEGMFFPDTYLVPRGTSDVSILRRAYTLMQKKLDEAWKTRAPNLPYRTPYEALIVASLIEKETAVKDERPIVADVILKRLAVGMRLQIDPTVTYGLRKTRYQPMMRSEYKVPSAYNTYLKSGLPPTPIAMPSWPSIEAALHPKPNSYFYYVSDGKGHHIFSATFEEHMKAVANYRKGQAHAKQP